MNPSNPAVTYNRVPYPIFTFYQTHPNRLATIATLMGMEPPDINTCRVLELGCATGANLFPMAAQFPNATFVGIDIASRQIEVGQKMVDDLGLNDRVKLHTMDVLDIPADFGEFDYIIAHGLFSWVSDEVRTAILGACNRHLSPNGIAYISYNVYPGWHFAEAPRDFMLYHTRNIDDLDTLPAEAIKIVEWAHEALQDTTNHAHGTLIETYQYQLQDQLERAGNRSASSLLHDELAPDNQPFYFHEFIDLAKTHGLKYLAESHFSSMMVHDFPDDVVDAMNDMSGEDLLRREQYMDFLRNRRFRQTLLVRDTVDLERGVSPNVVDKLFFSTRADPMESNDPHQLPTRFFIDGGLHFDATNAATSAAMMVMREAAPRALSFGEILVGVREVLGIETIPIEQVNILVIDLLQLYSIHDYFITPRLWRPNLPTAIPSKPKVWDVAQLLATYDEFTVNQLHQRVSLNNVELVHWLLPYVDGTRDYAALVEVLRGWVDEGRIKVHAEDDETTTYILSKQLDMLLEWLFVNAMLIADAA